MLRLKSLNIISNLKKWVNSAPAAGNVEMSLLHFVSPESNKVIKTIGGVGCWILSLKIYI